MTKVFVEQPLALPGSANYFLVYLWNWVFQTNIESKAAVTLKFEDLAVKRYLFLKFVCICWWKISNYSISTFHQCEVFLFKYLKTKCNSVRERVFLPFLAHCFTLSAKYFKRKTSNRSKVPNWSIWDFSPTNEYIFIKHVLTESSSECSISLHVIQKNPISEAKKKKLLPQKSKILRKIFFSDLVIKQMTFFF